MKVPNIKKSKVKKEVLMPPFCGGDFLYEQNEYSKNKKGCHKDSLAGLGGSPHINHSAHIIFPY